MSDVKISKSMIPLAESRRLKEEHAVMAKGVCHRHSPSLTLASSFP